VTQPVKDTHRKSALVALARGSVELIERYQHPSGAYPASPNFPVYRYSWFRDGAFIADAMSRAGRAASASRFFGWCARALTDRREHILDLVERGRRGEPIDQNGYLPARLALDGRESPGSEDWWNFQLDGYGTWLWALTEHCERHGEPIEPYADAVDLTARYLCQFWAEPCFDWWEEHAEHRHPSTLAAIYAGLRAATTVKPLDPELAAACERASGAVRSLVLDAGVHDGHLVKWLGDGAVDGSLIACTTPFGLVPASSPIAAATYAEVVRQLAVPGGGVYRYLRDTYYGGGEWLLLTAFLGWHEARTGRRDAALARLAWIAEQASPDGWLPEQVSGRVLAPDFVATWRQRWGDIADPLLWSHAMYLTLAVELGLTIDLGAEPEPELEREQEPFPEARPRQPVDNPLPPRHPPSMERASPASDLLARLTGVPDPPHPGRGTQSRGGARGGLAPC
jgi:GH15 family glucan-1,4-alpha-glucosidase